MTTPTIVRDPELAAVLAELQRVRNGIDRIEELLMKPKPPQLQLPPVRKSWWRR